MATTTPNNLWPVPTSTDYVADGAVAIESLGDAIDASVGNGLKAWVAYTPTLSGLTIGNGTLNFVYCQIGKTVHVRGIATLGTTSSMTGPLDVGIPVTSTGYGTTGMSPIGNATFWSGSVPIGFGTLTSVGNSAAFRILAISAAGTYTTVADISSTVPFAWSSPSGKFFACSFTYQAA